MALTPEEAAAQMEGAAKLMRTLLVEVAATREALSEANRQQREHDWLIKVVRDGDGNDSLLIRVSRLEDGVENLCDRFTTFESIRVADATGRWSWRSTLITGLVALITALIGAVVALAKRS